MKVNTDELIGPALDWAVAECEGHGEGYMKWWRAGCDKRFVWFHPSSYWSQAGLIIEREGISILDGWHAYIENMRCPARGETPLVAAMRCYVKSRLGDEVDVPEELE